MERQFDLLRQTRDNILSFASGLTIEQLNEIPENFNNNIIWNIGHLVAAEQTLLYRLSGTECTVHMEFIDRYKKGTRPEKFIGVEEWQFIQEHLISSVGISHSNYRDKVFHHFKSYETSYGFTLHSIEDAIAFVNVHEGMHFGFMKALLKALKKN